VPSVRALLTFLIFVKANKHSDSLHALTLLFELPPFNFSTSHQQDKSEFTFISEYFDPRAALPLKLRII
jgi:hypothetical protein